MDRATSDPDTFFITSGLFSGSEDAKLRPVVATQSTAHILNLLAMRLLLVKRGLVSLSNEVQFSALFIVMHARYSAPLRFVHRDTMNRTVLLWV